jgi:hypothetical protein
MLVQVENNNFNRDRYGAFSSVTEEHGENFFGDPPPPSPKKFSGHTTIFPETPTMFIATVDVYLL